MKAKGAVRNKVKKGRISNVNWMRLLKPVSIATTLICIVLSVTLLLAQLINKDVDRLELISLLEHVSEKDRKSVV